jgi:hypothetical protein
VSVVFGSLEMKESPSVTRQTWNRKVREIKDCFSFKMSG